MLEGWGTDEGSIPREQLFFGNALAQLRRQGVARLADVDETDAICRAARVGTAALAVTLEGWRGEKKNQGEMSYK